MRLQTLSVLLASSLLACGDEASIGDVCGPDAACRSAAIEQKLELTTLRTQPSALGTLAPTWTKREELGLRDAWQDGAWRAASRIAAAEDGGVWLFQSSSAGVTASLLDASASVLHTQIVAPPAGLRAQDEPSQGLGTVTNGAHGPVLTVAWRGRCDWSTNCDEPEALVFDVDATTTVHRVRPGHYFEAAYRTPDGQALYIPWNPIRKLGLDGKTLWARELKANALDRVPGFEGDDPYRFESLESAGAILGMSPTGTLTAPVAAGNTHGAADGPTQKPVGLLHVSPTGELKLVPHGASVLAVIDGRERAVAYDAKGGMYAAYSSPQGDLVAFHSGDGEALHGYRLVRERTSSLSIAAIAVDPAGTLFLATQAQASDETSLLCRLPADGEGRCVTMVDAPHSMQAPIADVVFTLSRAGLQRYDMP